MCLEKQKWKIQPKGELCAVSWIRIMITWFCARWETQQRDTISLGALFIFINAVVGSSSKREKKGFLFFGRGKERKERQSDALRRQAT